MHIICLSIPFSLTSDDDDDDDKMKSKSQYTIFGTAPSFISPQVQTFSLPPYSWSSSFLQTSLWFQIADKKTKILNWLVASILQI